MQYWLLKSEPSAWSWQDQKKNKITGWDGVRNYQACNYLRQMQKGDLAFFYHSVTEKSIQGTVRVIREYYPDLSDETGRFVMVDVEYHQELLHAVSLTDLKADPRLTQLPLIRQSRLSVMPIVEEAWHIICQKGQLKKK